MRKTLLLTVFSDWLPKLAAFLSVVLVARSLGASDFAWFAVALSWLGYAWWTVDLGQAGYSIRALAAADGPAERRVGSEIFSLYAALALGVSLVLAVALVVSGAAGAPEGRLLLAMSPYLLAYALFPDWWLRARGQLVALGLANWAVVLFFLAGWALSPAGSEHAYALAYGLSPLAGAVVAWAALARHDRHPRWTASWSRWRVHLRTSLLFGAAGLGGQVAVPLTLALMTATGDRRAAGAFALGLRAAASAANALWLLLQNALPRLLHTRARVSVRLLLVAAALPALGLSVAAALWTPLVAPLVGESYRPAGGHLLLGAALLVAWGPKYVVEIGLISRYGDVPRIVMNAVPPAVVLVALAVGTAGAGTAALALALIAGEAAAAGIGFLLLSRREPTAPDLVVADRA